ncbi:MAG: Imm42 family immunity protein [Puia sp.]|nr:Imm42 family immunity protein [Puia sp.]
METFGNKNIFAFQYEISEKIDRYVYGHLAFWIGGKLIGDYIGYSTISISVSFLEDFLKQYPRRIYPGSEFKKSTELFFELYDIFFDENVIIDPIRSQYTNIFWLNFVGEYSLLDQIGMILINEPNLKRQRLVWKYFVDSSIEEFFLPYDYFDKVANDFVEKANAQMKDLGYIRNTN